VQWRKYQDRSEPERLVFSETWARTVITDNLGGHNAKAVRQLIRIADAKLFSLSKYSAELNLIKQIFAKLKHLSREATAHSVETSCATIAPILAAFTSDECANYFQNSGYA